MNDLQQARERAGLSRKEVCDVLEIPYRSLQNWELGERKPPAYVANLLLEFYRNKKAGE